MAVTYISSRNQPLHRKSLLKYAFRYPLEQLRTLAQAGDTANDLLDLPPRFRKFGPLLGRVAHAASLDRQGVERLYQGCPAVIQTLALSNFLYFFLNAWAKKRLPALSQVKRATALVL